MKENIDIKENLNIILAKRIKLNKEPKQKNIIFKEEKINKEKEKEKEQKKEKETIEEQTLEECEEIINIIKNTIPKAEILSQAEKNLYISKLKKILTMKKENSNSKNTEKKLNKSRTERTLKVLNLEDEKSKTKSSHDKNSKKFYFSCLNYEIKEIGEQLINISTKSIKKIKRKELYK